MTSVPFSSHSNTDMNAPCFALTSSFSAGFSWGKCANIPQKSALCLRLIDEASRAHISLIAPSDTSRCPRRCENFQSVGGCLCFCHPLSNNIRGCGVSDSALLRHFSNLSVPSQQKSCVRRKSYSSQLGFGEMIIP